MSRPNRKPGRTKTVGCPELEAAFQADPWLSRNVEAIKTLAERLGKTSMQLQAYWMRQRNKQGVSADRPLATEKRRKKAAKKPKKKKTKKKKKVEAFDNDTDSASDRLTESEAGDDREDLPRAGDSDSDLTELSDSDDYSSDDEPLAKRIKANNDRSSKSRATDRSPPLVTVMASKSVQLHKAPPSPESPIRRTDSACHAALAWYSPTPSDFEQLVGAPSTRPSILMPASGSVYPSAQLQDAAPSSHFPATFETRCDYEDPHEAEERFFVEVNLGIRKLDKNPTPESCRFSKEMQTWISEQIDLPKPPLSNARMATRPTFAAIENAYDRLPHEYDPSYYYEIPDSPSPAYEISTALPPFSPAYEIGTAHPASSSEYEISTRLPLFSPAYEIGTALSDRLSTSDLHSRPNSTFSTASLESDANLGSRVKLGQASNTQLPYPHLQRWESSTPRNEEPSLAYFGDGTSTRESSVESLLNPYRTMIYPQRFPSQTQKSIQSWSGPSGYTWVTDNSPTGHHRATDIYHRGAMSSDAGPFTFC